MALVINTNIASLTAQRNLASSQSISATAMERLSSGLRINSAKDDAAGLAIANRFSAQAQGLAVATRNASDGISLAQTAEGALQEVTDNLLRMRELAVQAANGTLSAADRTALQTEFSALRDEIQRVATSTTFNGLNLLNGDFASQTFQVGDKTTDTVTMATIDDVRTSALGLRQGYSVTSGALGATSTGTATTVTIGTNAAVSLGTIASDASQIAAAINQSGLGFVATADATVVAGAASTAAADTTADTITINGVAISITATQNATTDRANAINLINAQSAVTGVVATDAGNSITLTANDGRNIITAFTAGNANTANDYGLDNAAAFAGAAVTNRSTINVEYTAPAGQTGNVVFAGAYVDTVAIGSAGTALSATSVATQSGATTAMTTIDSALTRADTARGSLGASQARFESVVSSTMIARESAEASRSRIVDADFAAETAAMTKGQILQQAGISVLAQANAMPQQVLSLLQ
jgi:flagellin